jgi:hypothetical protein
MTMIKTYARKTVSGCRVLHGLDYEKTTKKRKHTTKLVTDLTNLGSADLLVTLSQSRKICWTICGDGKTSNLDKYEFMSFIVGELLKIFSLASGAPCILNVDTDLIDMPL